MKMQNAVRMAVFSAAFAGFATAANAQAVQFFAVLDGGNEVSGTTAATGDLNGSGVASVQLGASGELCFSLLVRGISNPTVAHIHPGAPGETGGPVVTLTPVPTTGNPGSSAGCLTGVSTMTISQIRANPGRFYINVHTGQFPNGAIRGQLF